jgi:hypothetical protein
MSDSDRKRERKSGYWEFVEDPPAVPPAAVVDGTRCSAESCHPFTFGVKKLQNEKYRYYGACAEGCVKCVRAYIGEQSIEFLKAVSDSKTYTATDFAIFELLKNESDVALRQVVADLLEKGVVPLYYEPDGSSWKERR